MPAETQAAVSTADLPPLPGAFIARLTRIVPATQLDSVLDSFTRSRSCSFRINTLLAPIEDVRAELEDKGFHLAPVSWCPEAFTIPANQRRELIGSAAVREGRIYVQNPSSMLAPVILAPRAGETVLDLAAAPGGKTLHLAALMGNQGRLSAVERVRSRYHKLRAVLERYGASMVRTYLTDGRSVGRKVPERFDRVLLDAPCSSEAQFTRQDPKSWAHWSARKIKESSRKQKGLLASAIASLKPGGTLLYCTCTFAPEENELVVDDALRKQGHLIQIQTMTMPVRNIQQGLSRWGARNLHPELVKTVRVLPDGHMDGFFLCLLRKR